MSGSGWDSHKAIWIAAGGTAGHLLPALGVAEAIAADGVDRAMIGFIGSGRVLEDQIIEPYGYQLLHLEMTGLARRLSLRQISFFYKMLKGVLVLLVRTISNRPKVVVGFGGYFSFPPLFVAWLARVPTVVVETNAVPGLANKLLARLASVVFVTSGSWTPKRSVSVGIPLRPELSNSMGEAKGKISFRETHGVKESDLLICIFGGSLGALKINQSTIDAIDQLRKDPALPRSGDIVIYHVIGSRDYGLLVEKIRYLSEQESSIRYIYKEFDPKIYEAISESDLIISRAGSGTIAELGYFAKPSILIPLPGAPGDHQWKNASTMASSGAAILIADGELDGMKLAQLLNELIPDVKRLNAMASSAADAFVGNGAKTVARRALALSGIKEQND